ncbi:exopolysaccharide biosynthesis protein [Martelella lutilitoris]|uniref:exopolysaccharide biosynthesis protein n=1 Tax=Martelella lutilitoris TaxID=2583532 RepID=UPI001FEE3C08|nr:exopolysaccharide biosynthesis protein [Martelella lutilitoris]
MHDDEAGAEPRSHEGDRLSEILACLRPGPDGRLSLEQLDDALAERSFGAFIVLFSIPNLIPLPPGATLLLGLPLILVSWQMMVSRHTRVWLPERIARFSVDGARGMAILDRVLPWLRWIESAVRPRFWFLETRRAERALGAFALLLSIVVFFPIPFGNWLPALALAIIGLSATERDGYGLIIGLAVGVFSILLASLVIVAAGALIALLF